MSGKAIMIQGKSCLVCTLCEHMVIISGEAIKSISWHMITQHGIANIATLFNYITLVKRSSPLKTKFSCRECQSYYLWTDNHIIKEHMINKQFVCQFTSKRYNSARKYLNDCDLVQKLILILGNGKCCREDGYLNLKIDKQNQAAHKDGDIEVVEDEFSTRVQNKSLIYSGSYQYVLPELDAKDPSEKVLKPIKQANARSNHPPVIRRYKRGCRLCSNKLKFRCLTCFLAYCDKCCVCDPYICIKGLCMHCYMALFSVWNDLALFLTSGSFGVISSVVFPRTSATPGNRIRRGLVIHGPYSAKAGNIISEALALAVPLDRLNIPYGLERVVEATQYDRHGMPCFLADFAQYTFFAGSIIVPPLYLARDAPNNLCRLEVNLLAGLKEPLSYPIAVVTLRAIRDFTVGANKIRELTIRRQCLTEYPWKGAARLRLDPTLAIPPQHRPTALSPHVQCQPSAFQEYFGGNSPFGDPVESLCPF